MGKAMGLGILVCGDYLRWEKGAIGAVKDVIAVKLLRDGDANRGARMEVDLSLPGR